MAKNRSETLEEKIIFGFFRLIGKLIVWPFRKVIHPRPKEIINREDFLIKWQEAENLLALGGPAQLKQAVISADNLLDQYLKSQNLIGETLGERLKNARSVFSPEAYQKAWEAHKVRNEIVHNADYQLFSWQTNQVMNNFRYIFREKRII
jgi:hypothetical protein